MHKIALNKPFIVIIAVNYETNDNKDTTDKLFEESISFLHVILGQT